MSEAEKKTVAADTQQQQQQQDEVATGASSDEKEPKAPTATTTEGVEDTTPATGAKTAGAGAGDEETPAPPVAKQPKKEINPRYKDVRETGSWGQLSKKELIIAAVIFGVIVIGVIIAVVVLVTGGDDTDGEQVFVPPSTPVGVPSSVSAQEQVDIVLAAIGDNEALTAGSCVSVSDCPMSFQDDETQAPADRAMSWLIHSDTTIDSPDAILPRYALAAMYYGMAGATWKNNTNWLDGNTTQCEWYGVTCARSGTIDEVDLSSNGLTGKISVYAALLKNMQALWLRDNQLTGTIPGDALGSIPTLHILYLENNMLTGEVPESLRDNGVLQTLFIYGNDLTGEFSRVFCPRTISSPPVLKHFGLDCQEVTCTCCDENSCY